MYNFISGKPEQKDALVTNQSTLPSPVVTGSSPVKRDSPASNGHNRQANIDVNKPTAQFSDQQQQPMPHAKPENSLAFNQQRDALLKQPQQQSSGPSNVTASNPTKVSSDSTRPEHSQQKSSSVALGMYNYIRLVDIWLF